ncbi:protein FAM177A1 [Gastrophryne carolinensis]
MGKNSDLSDLQKGMIIGFRAKGGSISETAQFANCSRAAVVKVYREWSNGTIADRRRGNCGAPRAIDASGERWLQKCMKVKQHATVEQLTAQLNQGATRRVYKTTVQQTLLRMGIRSRQAVTAPPLVDEVELAEKDLGSFRASHVIQQQPANHSPLLITEIITAMDIQRIKCTSGMTDDGWVMVSGEREFESVELGDVGRKKKAPRRIIHFASGETMEEYSTDEEEELQEKKDLLPSIDPSKLTWGPYLWFYMLRVATSTLSVCDFLGEKIASVLGVSTPKYQYAIDEYYRMQKEVEEEDEENEMSERAEKQFQEQNESSAQTQQPEAATSFVNISFVMEGEDSGNLAQKQELSAVPT